VSELLGWLVLVLLPAALLVWALRSGQPSIGRWVALSGVASLWAQLNLVVLASPRYSPRDPSTFWAMAIGMPLFLAVFYVSAARAATRAWSRRTAVAWVVGLAVSLMLSFANGVLMLLCLAPNLVFVISVTSRLRQVAPAGASPPSTMIDPEG